MEVQGADVIRYSAFYGAMICRLLDYNGFVGFAMMSALLRSDDSEAQAIVHDEDGVVRRPALQ
jgi:hypothetical protein